MQTERMNKFKIEDGRDGLGNICFSYQILSMYFNILGVFRTKL
jgi:hypothetical protein